MDYEVIWSNILDAKDEGDAVREAMGMLQDPENTATFFRVINLKTHQETFRDFEEDLKKNE